MLLGPPSTTRTYTLFPYTTLFRSPQTPEEEGRLQDLEIENDDLVAALETELADGTPEAVAANDRLEAIERQVDEIEAGCSGLDPEVKTRLGTVVLLGADRSDERRGRQQGVQTSRSRGAS